MSVSHTEYPSIRLHRFADNVSSIRLPQRFTCPFHYTPHPLCIQASTEVQAYLSTQVQWKAELKKGKMFGVLVVKDSQNQLGYLAAFSGLLAEQNDWPYFVPPVFDLLQPDAYFKAEEANISAINRHIDELENSEAYRVAHEALKIQKSKAEHTLYIYKEQMQNEKKKRELRRQGILTSQEEAELIQESQFQKAELKRLKQRLQQEALSLQNQINAQESLINQLKNERKTRSAALQEWLFRQFKMYNAQGECKNLFEIFQAEGQRIPPAGSGECAAPKLLQYAYIHHLTPICMAEFWWGQSPKHEIRHHGHYYPACKSKCEPILHFMLQGLETDSNPLEEDAFRNVPLKIVYEDDWIVVVSKPAGMLSVPGKSDKDSMLSKLQKRYPKATGPLLVHRLDMDTSGLLLVAKTKEVHEQLQQQFHNRLVKKRYTALLENTPIPSQGSIDLPLCLDPTDRPRQMVHPVYGKPALTHYQVIGQQKGHTCISFFPISGRTHQLRVHAAHPQGLNSPIVGDVLYGQKADRLYLHASCLSFRHPITGQEITVTEEADWE